MVRMATRRRRTKLLSLRSDFCFGGGTVPPANYMALTAGSYLLHPGEMDRPTRTAKGSGGRLLYSVSFSLREPTSVVFHSPRAGGRGRRADWVCLVAVAGGYLSRGDRIQLLTQGARRSTSQRSGREMDIARRSSRAFQHPPSPHERSVGRAPFAFPRRPRPPRRARQSEVRGPRPADLVPGFRGGKAG